MNGEEYADEASFYLGQLAETRKDYDQALKWYSSVGEGDNHFDAQLSMALTMMKQKRFPAHGNSSTASRRPPPIKKRGSRGSKASS